MELQDQEAEVEFRELIEDEEFKSLIPQLSDEEYCELSENISEKGCINPIIVWNNIIVDGHNRYKICRLLALEYKVKDISFADRTEAKLWIIRHQLGRRNLNSFQKCELALTMEELIQQQAKLNQSAGGGAVRQKSAKPVDTREELARIAGVSHDTMGKARKIVDEASDEDKGKLRSGESSINAISRKLKCQEESAEQENSREKLVQTTIKGIECRMQKLSDMKEEIPSEYKQSLRTWIAILSGIVDCNKTGVAA